MIIPPRLLYPDLEFSVEMLAATSEDNQVATVWVRLTVTQVLDERAYVLTSKGDKMPARVGDEYMYRYEAAAVRDPDGRNEAP